jgi:hypothetical protein
MEKNKKQAAAIAAVMAYLRQEEEAAAMQAMAAPAAAPGVSAPAVPFKPWGVTGRQAQMQMRSLMEMKAFHGWKFR